MRPSTGFLLRCIRCIRRQSTDCLSARSLSRRGSPRRDDCSVGRCLSDICRMTTTPTEWLTIDQAAARLGCSTRTLQRRVRDGSVQAQHRADGRTLVEIERPLVAEQTLDRIERQADETNRIAALAAVTADRAIEAYRQQVATVEASLSDARSTARSWRSLAAVGLSVALSASVVAAWFVADAVATRRHLSDALTAVEGAEGRETVLLSMLSRVTASDTLADRIASAKAPPTDECVD